MANRKLASVVATSLVCFTGVIYGCDGDDTAGTTSDSGTVVDAEIPKLDSSSQPDAPPISDAAADAISFANAPRLHFVSDHIIYDANEAFRFCPLATTDGSEPTGASALDITPFPTKTFPKVTRKGLPTGRASLAPAFAPSYANLRLKFVAYRQSSIEAAGQGADSCKKLLANSAFLVRQDGGDGGALADAAVTNLLEGIDFSVVGDFPAGTFQDKKSYAVVLQGCPRNTPANRRADCMNFDIDKGTMRLSSLELDPTPAASGKNGLQLIYASESLLNFDTPAIGARVKYLSDAVSTTEVTAPEGVGVVASGGKALPAPPTQVPSLAGSSTIEVEDLFDYYFPNTLDQIAEVSEVSKTDLTAPGKTFTLVVVNDPSANDTDPQGNRQFSALHIVALPNE